MLRSNIKIQRSLKKILTVFTIFFLVINEGCSSESEDREKLVSAFKENFGFTPPKSVETIKLKNLTIYDTRVHWMSFTYDSTVLNKIIAHDQPLNVAESHSSKFQGIIEDLKKNANNPNWLVLPNDKTDRIYYKKDFLAHTFSEYFLWTNHEKEQIFLFVQFF